MTAELVLRTRCKEHGSVVRHSLGYHCDHLDDGKPHDLGSGVCHIPWCPGGSEVVLDPERVVHNVWVIRESAYEVVVAQAQVTVASFIDALEDS